jgi:dolichol-phosphate mannosyltransferase
LKKINFEGVKCKIVKLAKNYGSHSAVYAGILSSAGDFVTILSSDFQDNFEIVLRMHRKAVTGYDIIFPLRQNSAQPILVRLFSRFYSSLLRRFAIKDYPRKNFDIFFINKKVKEAILKTYEPNSSILLHIFNLGFKKGYIEYDRVERIAGKSKWTFAKKLKFLIDSFIGFSYFPIRLVTIMGITFFIFGITWTLFIFFRKIYFNDLLIGWPALTSILLLGFGVTNISLGIIAEYLWRTFDVSRNKQIFLIDEIINLNND